MKIGGIQELSLIDFPNNPCSVIFTKGCNFRCPYCHNPLLVKSKGSCLNSAKIMDFLISRKSRVEGVAISGGEPTLQSDLADFCKELKTLGFKVKLDTNGSRPHVLKALILNKLIDYVAMDLKSQKYPIEIFQEDIIESIQSSKNILESSNIIHEFRITCVHGVVEPHDIEIMLEGINKDIPIYLQETKIDKEVLDPAFFENNEPWSKMIMQDVVSGLDEKFNILIR